MTFSEAPAQLSLAKIIARLSAMLAAAKQGIPPAIFQESRRASLKPGTRSSDGMKRAATLLQAVWKSAILRIGQDHCPIPWAMRGWRRRAGRCPENGRANSKKPA